VKPRRWEQNLIINAKGFSDAAGVFDDPLDVFESVPWVG
jgi:hypothetical protein